MGCSTAQQVKLWVQPLHGFVWIQLVSSHSAAWGRFFPHGKHGGGHLVLEEGAAGMQGVPGEGHPVPRCLVCQALIRDFRGTALGSNASQANPWH